MLIAHDKDNNRIYANSGEQYKECYCPDCGNPVIFRNGSHNIPHFAHKADSECSYGKDKDSKSPWHIRMQEIFPVDSLEVRFHDEKTGELHIADVFLKESNTVIEFQHSPIEDEELVKRTRFHVSEGRRVVWIFDESKAESEYGRLKKSEIPLNGWPYDEFEFDWPRSPRKVLNALHTGNQLDNYGNLSICVYFGDEENTVHRIIRQELGFKEVVLSVHPIILQAAMDIDDFFRTDRYWLEQSPWKESVSTMLQSK